MKKSLIMLFFIIFLVGACSAQAPYPPAATSDITSPDVTQESPAPTPDNASNPPSFGEISNKVASFFRVLYSGNQKYRTKFGYFQSLDDFNITVGASMRAFLDETGALKKLCVSIVGETHFETIDYYIIADNLMFVTETANCGDIFSKVPMNLKGKFFAYYIVDGLVWQYAGEDTLIRSLETNQNYYTALYDAAIWDLFGGNKPAISNVEYRYSKKDDDSPTAYLIFDSALTLYNDSWDDVYETKKLRLPNYTRSLGYYMGSQLRQVFLERSTDSGFESYGYYLGSGYFQRIVKETRTKDPATEEESAVFEEFFIRDGKVMKFDLETESLIESPENALILEQYQTVMDEIESQKPTPTP